VITQKLKDHYTFAIERYENRVRLIVLDGGKEWVCRKVTPKEFTDFLHNNEVHLFKGCLQLDKAGSDVMVSVKGDNIGLISAQALLHSCALALSIA